MDYRSSKAEMKINMRRGSWGGAASRSGRGFSRF